MEYDVKFIPRRFVALKWHTNSSGSVSKVGPVAVWDVSKSEWMKKFMVLRRPYLYLYSSPNDLEEEAAISVFTLRLDHGERISDMLRVRTLNGSI